MGYDIGNKNIRDVVVNYILQDLSYSTIVVVVNILYYVLMIKLYIYIQITGYYRNTYAHHQILVKLNTFLISQC